MMVGRVMRVFFDRRGEVCDASRAARAIQADDVRIQFFRSGINLAVPVIRDHMLLSRSKNSTVRHRACGVHTSG